MAGNGDSPPFIFRTIVVEPGGARIYNEAEWLDAIVVVGRGAIELECLDGERRSFGCGDVLWLVGLPLRSLHNRGEERTVLVAVSRS